MLINTPIQRLILIIKPTRCTLISQIHFWNRTLHVSDSFSVHRQESSTVHTAIGICHTGYADSLRAGAFAPARKLLYSKNEFEKLVHLTDFL